MSRSAATRVRLLDELDLHNRRSGMSKKSRKKRDRKKKGANHGKRPNS